MRKLLLPLLFIVISCNTGPLEKSILEDLTVEEIQIAMEGDSLFEFHYQYLERLRDSVKKSEIRMARFEDVTYQKWGEFASKVIDSSYVVGVTNQIYQQWKDKNKEIIINVDSVAGYWTRYLEKNGFEITTFKKESMELLTDSNADAKKARKSMEIAEKLPNYVDDYIICMGNCLLEAFYIQDIAKEVLDVDIERYGDFFIEEFKRHLLSEHGKLGELLLLAPITTWEF